MLESCSGLADVGAQSPTEAQNLPSLRCCENAGTCWPLGVLAPAVGAPVAELKHRGLTQKKGRKSMLGST